MTIDRRVQNKILCIQTESGENITNEKKKKLWSNVVDYSRRWYKWIVRQAGKLL